MHRKQYVLVCAVFALIFSSMLVLAEGPRPDTGTFFKDSARNGLGKLTIINDNPQKDAVAVLLPQNNRPKLAIYIRSKESFTISGIEDGSYDMYFEIGNNWNSKSNKFADKGGFYRLDRAIPFETIERPDGTEYSVWTVALEEAAPNANEAGQKVSVNEEEFPGLE